MKGKTVLVTLCDQSEKSVERLKKASGLSRSGLIRILLISMETEFIHRLTGVDANAKTPESIKDDEGKRKLISQVEDGSTSLEDAQSFAAKKGWTMNFDSLVIKPFPGR